MVAGQNGSNGAAAPAVDELANENEEYTAESLQQAWNEFAEQRKMYLAEYQLLTQPFDRKDNEIVIHLHNPIQESLLDTFRSDLIAFLRKTLQNRLITVVGVMQEVDSKKVPYTNREKFDFLVQKYPGLKELRDRLGLDTDF